MTAVTRDGDVLGAHFAAGGSASPAEPARDPGGVRRGLGRSCPRRSPPPSGSASTSPGSSTERHDAQRRVDVALAKLHESDATLAAVAEELGQLRLAGPRRPAAEAERLDQRDRRRRRRRATSDLAGLADLEARLAAAEDATDEEPDTDRARAAGRGGPRRPPGRDGRPARAAHRPRSAPAPCTAAPTRWCAPPRPSARPGPAAIERRERLLREGRAAQAVGVGVGRRAGPARGVDRTAAAEARAGRRGEPRRAASRSCCAVRGRAARPGPRARRAGQLRAPRRDGPHPAADAHRAARGARARGARPRRRRAGRRLRPRPARCPFTGEVAERRGRRPSPAPYVREEQTKRLRAAERALAHARQGQPAGARGVLRAGGAAQVPHRAARGPQGAPARTCSTSSARSTPACEQVFTEAYADVRAAFDADLRPAVPRRRGPAGAHRPRRHAHHRHRGRGPAAGQEGQAALAALRWRAVAGRGGLPGRAVQGPAVAVLHPRRGRGGARRHQPRPAAGDLRGAARELPAARDHPPEADHGGRRRALRRHHARRRRLGGDQPAAARGRA